MTHKVSSPSNPSMPSPVTIHLAVVPRGTLPKNGATVSGDCAAPDAKRAVLASAIPPHRSTWRELIEGEQLGTLEVEKLDNEEAENVAALCLAHAAAHPDAVERVLFMNGNARLEAFKLLQAGGQHESERQKALALCFLQAGFALSAESLAPEVAELLVHRRE